VTLIATKPAKSTRKAKGDGHLRRGEILKAAERIFMRDGYQGATIRKIADEVGVSSTALYMHFRDKDEMLLEIVEGVITTLSNANAEIAARSLDALIRVRLMAENYIEFGFDNLNTYWLVYGSGETISSRHAQVSDMAARCYQQFRSTVAELEAEGRIAAGSTDLAAQVIWSACHGVVSLRICRPNLDWEDQEDLIQGMLGSVLRGLIIG
jgi:AcrR family transcriptional regulator